MYTDKRGRHFNFFPGVHTIRQDNFKISPSLFLKQFLYMSIYIYIRKYYKHIIKKYIHILYIINKLIMLLR